MKHILHSEEILPSAITLIGDSAGAHLLLSLILHISHPNPLIPALEVKGNFSNAVLISPWVSMNVTAASMTANKEKDILSTAGLEYWAQNFMGGASPDYWNSPLTAPLEWWDDLPIDDVLLVYGEDELLQDDTITFSEKLTVVSPAHHRC